MNKTIISFSCVIEQEFDRPYHSSQQEIDDGTNRILNRLKEAIVTNYHAKNKKNCIGSVEKVVTELFEDIKP